MPWTCRIHRKSYTPVAGVLNSGEELGLKLIIAEQNVFTFVSSVKSKMLHYVYINNTLNDFILELRGFEQYKIIVKEVCFFLQTTSEWPSLTPNQNGVVLLNCKSFV